jgi:hypothetical protein
MCKSYWFFVITILIGASLTGCAAIQPVDRWIADNTVSGPEIARHGHQPVIFANVDRRQVTLTFTVGKIYRGKVVEWLDEFTLHPNRTAILFYGEGEYKVLVTATETGKGRGGKKFFVPYRGRTFVYNGNHYAAGVIIGAKRR